MALVLVVYIAAWGLPLLIPDGLDGLGEAELTAGTVGIREATHVFWDSPLEHLWVRRFAVAEIAPSSTPVTDPHRLPEGWEVEVRVYTLFGLPYAAARFEHSGGSVRYRLPTGPIGLLSLIVLPVIVLPVAAIAKWWRLG